MGALADTVFKRLGHALALLEYGWRVVAHQSDVGSVRNSTAGSKLTLAALTTLIGTHK
jgi:hypothetical protein